jgi:hypothetical protein
MIYSEVGKNSFFFFKIDKKSERNAKMVQIYVFKIKSIQFRGFTFHLEKERNFIFSSSEYFFKLKI